MGHPKGLLELNGRPLIQHHIDRLRPLSWEVLVVLGAEIDGYTAILERDIHVITNPFWASTSQADSLRLAFRHLPFGASAWLVPVDTAPAAPETLIALLRATGSAVPVSPGGQAGHPALLGPNVVDQIRRASPINGVQTLLTDAARVDVVDPFVATNLNQSADWATFVGSWRERTAQDHKSGG